MRKARRIHFSGYILSNSSSLFLNIFMLSFARKACYNENDSILFKSEYQGDFHIMNKKTFGIIGCGFLGNIVADAYTMGLLEDYELIGVHGMPMEAAVSTSVKCDCACSADVDTLLAMKPDYIVETASVECVR